MSPATFWNGSYFEPDRYKEDRRAHLATTTHGLTSGLYLQPTLCEMLAYMWHCKEISFVSNFLSFFLPPPFLAVWVLGSHFQTHIQTFTQIPHIGETPKGTHCLFASFENFTQSSRVAILLLSITAAVDKLGSAIQAVPILNKLCVCGGGGATFFVCLIRIFWVNVAIKIICLH